MSAGLTYLDDDQLFSLRLFADATIVSGDWLRGSRLHELLNSYGRAEDAEMLEEKLKDLRAQAKDLGDELKELIHSSAKLETSLDEQLSVLKTALEPAPEPPGAKPSKRNQQIARQSHMLEIEGAAKRLVDTLTEVSDGIARLRATLMEHAGTAIELSTEVL